MPRLGAMFLTAALGPLNHAAHCIMARQVDTGLQELTRDNLMGGVLRGITTVAEAVGLPEREVKRLLPMAQLQTTVDRIELSQQKAFEQWRVHTGHIGGLLTGIADLTEDGRAPDAALCVLRIAKKMKLDKDLAVPLTALAEELDMWHVLLDQCRGVLDQGDHLVNAYRRRRRTRFLLLGIIALSCILGLSGATFVWATRVRIARALEMEDACTVEQLDESDASWASSEQSSTIEEKRKTCEAERELARKKAEAERRAAEKRREAKRKEEERRERCKALGRHVENDTFDAEDEKTAGKHAALLKRVAARKIEASDVATELDDLPCRDTEGGKRIMRSVAEAAATSAAGWVLAHAPSKGVQEALRDHKDSVGEETWTHFVGHVEHVAEKAVVSGDDERMAHAQKLCKMLETVGLEQKKQCQAALALGQ